MTGKGLYGTRNYAYNIWTLTPRMLLDQSAKLLTFHDQYNRQKTINEILWREDVPDL